MECVRIDYFEYENGFYHKSKKDRINKLIAQYDIFKETLDIEGDIIECGVFKGSSLIRLATFRDFYGIDKKVIGFDTFGEYPKSEYEEDNEYIDNFTKESGGNSISIKLLKRILEYKAILNVELISGDVLHTIPEYIERNEDLSLSFINMDLDTYKPTLVALEHLWPRLNKKGIIVLDNYNVFPGETKAVDEYFEDKDIVIKKYHGIYYIEKRK